MKHVPEKILLRGVLVGALSGLLIGFYLFVMTEGYVIQRGDFATPLAFEQTQDRFRATLVFGCALLFAIVGAVMSAGQFGPWLRHSVYGFTGGIALLVAAAFVVDWWTDTPQFRKANTGPALNAVREVGVPAILVIGPVLGIVGGRLWDQRYFSRGKL